jgi:hypothetical protein
MKFWGVELRDSDRFSGLGIPSGAEIEIGWNERKEITVVLPDESNRVFVMGEGDRVTSVKGWMVGMLFKDARE